VRTFACSTQADDATAASYFFLPDPKFGCQPAAAPFWLGAAAIVLIISFLGFLDSRLLFAMPFSPLMDEYCFYSTLYRNDSRTCYIPS
jgi:hypothetical protein